MLKRHDKNVLKRKLKKIKFLILDVDGVLTDGKLIYNSEGIELKAFDVKDGYGLVRLRESGVKIGIITAKNSRIIEVRAKDLGIDELYQNIPDKLNAYEEIKLKYKLTDEEIAYIGDDIPDLGVLKRVGLSIAVNDAIDEVKKVADYVTEKKGGNGAVREVTDLIIEARGRMLDAS
ncbi:MAG: KdsC family phosphatase [bacterium]